MAYDPGDALLYALSSWQEMSWQRFKNCFDEVMRMYQEMAYRRRQKATTVNRVQVLRTFSALGHIDIRNDESGIHLDIAPAMLVPLPTYGHPRAILCGARSPALLTNIYDAARSEHGIATRVSQRSTSPLGPTRVEIQCDDKTRLEAIAHKVGIHYSTESPARSLSGFSQSLIDYCGNLEWSSGRDIDWFREDFDIESFRFSGSDAGDQLDRFSRYRNPWTRLYRYRLWRDGRFADNVDLDWGRYALFAYFRKEVLTYQEQTRTVLVPVGAQLPALLARSLALCSGLIPRIPQRHPGFLAFAGVPPSIFKKVAMKVSQISGD